MGFLQFCSDNALSGLSKIKFPKDCQASKELPEIWNVNILLRFEVSCPWMHYLQNWWLHLQSSALPTKLSPLDSINNLQVTGCKDSHIIQTYVVVHPSTINHLNHRPVLIRYLNWFWSDHGISCIIRKMMTGIKEDQMNIQELTPASSFSYFENIEWCNSSQSHNKGWKLSATPLR